MGTKSSRRVEEPPLIVTPSHAHPLVLVPAKQPGTKYAEGFKCDICLKSTPSHKSKCTYDVCEGCASKGPLTQPTLRVSSHKHPLLLVPSHHPTPLYGKGFWCDECKQHAPTPTRWWCSECNFDLCENCVEKKETPATTTTTTTTTTTPPPTPTPTLPQTTEEDDENLCIICFDNPKTAYIAHEGGEHICCCIDCAKAIQAKDNLCPLCRITLETIADIS